MNRQTLEKAKGIERTIKSLEDEVRNLSDIDNENSFLLNVMEKIAYKKFYNDVYITMTKDDAKVMIELRNKRISELEKELEQL